MGLGPVSASRAFVRQRKDPTMTRYETTRLRHPAMYIPLCRLRSGRSRGNHEERRDQSNRDRQMAKANFRAGR